MRRALSRESKVKHFSRESETENVYDCHMSIELLKYFKSSMHA